ncbi:MAG TPA: FAD-binding oxidoreductase [Candidatus Elarobacter sp.]
MTTIAIAGVVPRDVVTPRSVDELAQVVRELHDARKTFAFVGGGTHLALGNAPRALDTVIRMTALDAIVDYTPEDQTITVEAGITLAELDRVLEQHRQMLPLDVADRARSTVGGLVATNAYGRRRQRYGTAKDLIVGVGMVRPDGVRARGGGKVVKNVAGFDLPKLMVGSLGTLGAIATVTFRLYPIAQATRAAALTFEDAEGASAAARALLARQLEPESVALYNYDTLVVSIAGTQRGVDAQMTTLLDEIAPATSARARDLSDLERESYEQRERAVRRDGAWRVRISAPPSAGVATLGSFVEAPPIAVPVSYPMLGIALHAYADAPAPVTGLRERVAAETRGAGHVVIAAMPDAARGTVDAWGPPPPSFALMRAMKHNFDPHGLCNPGRFIGSL